MNLTTSTTRATRPVCNLRWWCCCLVLILFAALTGCATRGGLGFASFRKTSPRFTFETSKSELFAHLNRTSQHVHGWRSTDCSIHARGMPGSPKALIACEAPRHFRTIVSAPVMGRLLDIGSNEERFWFWAKEPGRTTPILTAAHEELSQVQKHFPIPVNPEWLMEVMGVVPFDENDFQLPSYDQEEGTFNLVSASTDSEGRRFYRRILVDGQTGNILKHELYGAQRDLIATASLADYRMIGPQQVLLPHHIQLEWPQTGMAFKLNFSHIEINPSANASGSDQWELPNITDQVVDLGRMGDQNVFPASSPGR